MVELPVQVPQRHVDGRLGARVVDDAPLNPLQQVLQVVHVAVQDGSSDVVLNGSDDGSRRVARDDARGGRLTVADRARVGVDLHHDVLDAVHAAERRLERNPQGDGYPSQPNPRDAHDFSSLRWP